MRLFGNGNELAEQVYDSRGELDDGDCFCEHCERDVYDEDELTLVAYKDADGDRTELWLCDWCIEGQVWV